MKGHVTRAAKRASNSQSGVSVLSAGGASLGAVTFEVALAAASVGVKAFAESKNLLLSALLEQGNGRGSWGTENSSTGEGGVKRYLSGL